MAERGPICPKCSNDLWDREGGYGDVPRSRVCANCGKEVVLRAKPTRQPIKEFSATDLLDLTAENVRGMTTYLKGELSLTPAQVKAVEQILHSAVKQGHGGSVDIDQLRVDPMYHPGSFLLQLSGVASPTARGKPGRFYVEYRGAFVVGVNGAISGLSTKETGYRALIYEWDYFGKKR